MSSNMPKLNSSPLPHHLLSPQSFSTVNTQYHHFHCIGANFEISLLPHIQYIRRSFCLSSENTKNLTTTTSTAFVICLYYFSNSKRSPAFCSCFRTIFSQHKCRFFYPVSSKSTVSPFLSGKLQSLYKVSPRFDPCYLSDQISQYYSVLPVHCIPATLASFFQIGQTCFCLSAFLQGPFPLPGMLWISAKQCHLNEVYFHLSTKEQKQ